jgi:hypothetical protein
LPLFAAFSGRPFWRPVPALALLAAGMVLLPRRRKA